MTDRLIINVETNRHKAQAASNLIEHDLNRFWGGALLLRRRCGGRRRRRRSFGRARLRTIYRSHITRWLFAKQISKLIFAKPWCARNQINSRQLRALRALARIEQDVSAVRTPRNRVAKNVRKETRRPSRISINRNNVDVFELVRRDGNISQPFSIRRPGKRAIRAQWRTFKDGRLHDTICPGGHVHHPQLFSASDKR